MRARAFGTDEKRAAGTYFEGGNKPFLRVDVADHVRFEPFLAQCSNGAQADRGDRGRTPAHPTGELVRAVRARDDHAVVVANIDRVVREGLDLDQRLGVVRSPDEMLVSHAYLERERTLSRLGNDLVGLEPPADLAGEAEPVEPAGSEDDRVEPTLATLAQACVDVATKGLDRERRLEREQLRAATDRGGADTHPGPKPVRAAERVTRILARQVCTDA